MCLPVFNGTRLAHGVSHAAAKQTRVGQLSETNPISAMGSLASFVFLAKTLALTRSCFGFALLSIERFASLMTSAAHFFSVISSHGPCSFGAHATER